MKCVVCQLARESGENKKTWGYTTDRLHFSQIQALFKLFDITKNEFMSGSICPCCYDLLLQIDSLEYQMLQQCKNLKARVKCFACEDEYIVAQSAQISDQSPNGDDCIQSIFCQDDPIGEDFKAELSKSKKRRMECPEPLAIKLEPPANNDDNSGEGQMQMPFRDTPVDKRTVPKPRAPPPSSTFTQDNLDFNVSVIKTTRGNEQLLYENYTYNKLDFNNQPKVGDFCRWKCTFNYGIKTGCKGKLKTTRDGSCVLLDSKTDHNHKPPDEQQINAIYFREQVKQLARNHPDMKPAEILSNSKMLLPASADIGIKKVSIMRFIQRTCNKVRGTKINVEDDSNEAPVRKPPEDGSTCSSS
ncbi:hypothetical protein TCAL_14977 [Tigriopus californicus]|uniref:FLYWCH-type domain-containing protein n=1 Tax=Tigriopus californicus TaxID=6832 RepID=A0A553N742_TIGCA|nr:hypothetical protein TCAL_14977 [Tigriopus californicus]